MTKQDYGTPPEFIEAMERRWDHIAFDLAAHVGNRVVGDYFGPGSLRAEDSLSQDWTQLQGFLYLNPPYSDVEPWAKKCANSIVHGGPVIRMLIPAAIGTNYFREWIWPYANVIALSPRISFLGQEGGKADSFKGRDLMLCEYYYGSGKNFSCWRWKQ